jgi:hypothetical protein
MQIGMSPDVLVVRAGETRGMDQVDRKTCTLHLVTNGKTEMCPGERCALWESGGAVLAGDCLIERLGIDLTTPDLARYLLELRERLERLRNTAEAEAAHREFSRRLGCDV